MGRKMVMGDIHGELEKLQDVLHKAKFNYEEDTLIFLGDVCDRGKNVYGCIEQLLKIKNLISIKGNHDDCFYDSVLGGHKNILYEQGGRETLLSYTRNTDCGGDPCKIPDTHKEFFLNQKLYHIDEDNNLFIHGGFNRHSLIVNQTPTTYMWDRDLFLAAVAWETMKDKEVHPFKTKDKFNKIYIGHTPTLYWGSEEPIRAANVINVDTGCGKGAYPLTMIDLDTDEVFQSFK